MLKTKNTVTVHTIQFFPQPFCFPFFNETKSDRGTSNVKKSGAHS